MIRLRGQDASVEDHFDAVRAEVALVFRFVIREFHQFGRTADMAESIKRIQSVTAAGDNLDSEDCGCDVCTYGCDSEFHSPFVGFDSLLGDFDCCDGHEELLRLKSAHSV